METVNQFRWTVVAGGIVVIALILLDSLSGVSGGAVPLVIGAMAVGAVLLAFGRTVMRA